MMRLARLDWPGRPHSAPTATDPPELGTDLEIPANKPDLGSLRLIRGDALSVAHRLLADGQGESFDVIHLDPPFGSAADYGRVRDLRVAGRDVTLEVPAYGDDDGGDLAGYLDALYPVLCQCRKLLTARGSFYLHLDFRRGPYVRLLLDEIFGADNLLNEIVWAYGLGGSSRQRFGRKHDVIYFYARDAGRHYFAPPQEAATSSMLAGKPKGATDTWVTEGRDDEAQLVRAWPDPLIEKTLSNRDPERTGYPTQKPLALALRMLQASAPLGGKVLDLMAGSGTFGVAALLLGHDAVLGDASLTALDVARGRAVAAGAAVRLESLRPHATFDLLEAQPEVTLAQEGARRVARLGHLRLPWPAAATHQVEVAEWLAANNGNRGADLLGAWGIAEQGPDGGLRTLAWWDAGAQRARGPVPECLAWRSQATAGPLHWLGVDVLGRCWRAPID